MGTNNRTNNVKLESAVKLGKPPVYQPCTFNKPQARPSSRTPKPQKVESLGDYLSKMNDQERLTFELDRFGHFTVEEGDSPWTQAEVDEEWARLHPPSSSPRSLAFILNWDFKPASEPEYIVLDDDDDQTSVPSPVQVPAISSPSSGYERRPFMPVAKETPVNYWDDWRAREDKEEQMKKKEAERAMKKRKSDEDWG